MFAILGKYERARLPGQAVKTLASHAGIRGSIPLGVTQYETGVHHEFRFCFIYLQYQVRLFSLHNS